APTQLEALPYVGRRSLLTGVAHLVLAELAGARVRLGEAGRGMVALGGVEAHADPEVAVGQRVLERLHGLAAAEVAQEADDQVRAHAEPVASEREAVADASQHRLHRDAASGVRLGVAEHLGMTDVV